MGLPDRDVIERMMRECQPSPQLIKLLGEKYLGVAEYHFDGNGNVKLVIVPKFRAEIRPAA